MKSKKTNTSSLSLRLGIVSFLNDCSSEIISRALPLFLVTTLGATPVFVGIIEGVAESISIFLKAFSGWLSDRMQHRKPLVVFGYAASALSRVTLFFAQFPIFVGLSRVFDRTGKGLRTAPRDAMVADASKLGTTGRNFGITRFLDTLGAMTGTAIAIWAGVGRGVFNGDDFHTIVKLSLPFAALAIVYLVFFVPNIPRAQAAKVRISFSIPKGIRVYLAIVFVFAMANSSDAFLVLRGQEIGLNFREILFVLLAFNAIAAGLAVPAGILSDRYGRVRFLVLGWLLYAVCYLAFGLSSSPQMFILSFITYGAFYGFTEGVEKALLADLLEPEKRGVGFGSLQFVLGLAALPSSFLMGAVMTRYGSATAFALNAVLALAATCLLILWKWRSSQKYSHAVSANNK